MSCLPFFSASSNPYSLITDTQLRSKLEVWVDKYPSLPSSASADEVDIFTKKLVSSLKKISFKDQEMPFVVGHLKDLIENGNKFTSYFIKKRLADLTAPHFWHTCIGDRSQIDRLQKIYQAIFWIFPKALVDVPTEQTSMMDSFLESATVTPVQRWISEHRMPPYRLHARELKCCIRQIVAPLKTMQITEDNQPLIVTRLSAIARISEVHKSMLDRALSEIINPRSYPNSSIVAQLPLTKIRCEVSKTRPRPWSSHLSD